MVYLLKFSVLLAAAVLISGSPVVEVSKDCSGYLWNVIGHHYVPRENCLEEKKINLEKQINELKESFMRSESKLRKRREDEEDGVSSVMRILNAQLSLGKKPKAEVICTACKSAIEMMQFFIREGNSDDELIGTGQNLCKELKILTDDLCEGIVEMNGPALFYILRKSKLIPEEICSFLIATDCDSAENPNLQWDVQIPDEPKKPKIVETLPPLDDAPKLKVLHISDMHFDPEYVENTWAECKLPLCCRADNGEPTENATLGGKWGGWKCDTPERTIDNLLEHITKEHPDIDYILWTGDLPPHDSWSFLKNDSLDILNRTVSKMTNYFPNVPIYPALGNHEAVPPNLFPLPNIDEKFSIKWLYDELEEKWSRWLPDNSSLETIRRGAFYTTLIRPGFRVVSLNMNYCFYDNWWLILNSTDPLEELQWLIEVLQLAESKGEKVHIIGHIPAGHVDCLKVWQRNYYQILDRYESTITAQFFGHTHNDEYELFLDKNNTERAIGVAYIGPSVTTYTYLNPGYRIYYIDGDHDKTTRYVVDYETWILDLEKANKEDNPVWTKLYSAKEAYKMDSLLPQEWKNLLERIATDENSFQTYYKHYWKDSPKRPSCDDSCKKDIICLIRSCSQYGEYQHH